VGSSADNRVQDKTSLYALLQDASSSHDELPRPPIGGDRSAMKKTTEADLVVAQCMLTTSMSLDDEIVSVLSMDRVADRLDIKKGSL